MNSGVNYKFSYKVIRLLIGAYGLEQYKSLSIYHIFYVREDYPLFINIKYCYTFTFYS